MGSGGPSHLRAAARLAVAGLRRRAERRAAPPLEPARKLAVERWGIEVNPSQLRRYLTATGGSPSHEDISPGAPLPPTYSAVWETALTLELLALDGMPFPSQGVVHLASELVVLRPLRVGDRVRSRLELQRLEGHRGGVVLALKYRCWNGAGQLCQENRTDLLVRGIAAKSVLEREQGGDPAKAADGSWEELATWDLPADAGLRYARASGDFNPIHLWPWSSRLLGFSRPILHGHCTLAMVAHELHRWTGRPLRKLAGRFRAPLELPCRVRLEVAGERDGESIPIRLVEPGGGGKPYVEGGWVG